MTEFNSIEEVSQEIKNKLNSSTDKKSIALLYAFNGTWKTRISREFDKLNYSIEDEESEKKKVLCYNAFLEDLFSWDNEKNTLKFTDSWEMKLIKDQWLDKKIINNFQIFLGTKIEPKIDFENRLITFTVLWDNNNYEEIKISRGEESIFIWTIFYTIVENAIDELIQIKKNRSTDVYNDLEYIILDDPVSSIDDTRIITLAVKIVELIKININTYLNPQIEKKEKELISQDFADDYIKSRVSELRSKLSENYNEIKLKFLITTHHALFYNVLYNSFYRFKKEKKYFYILHKNDNNELELRGQNNWSPFGYHLLIKDEIQKAINTWNIQKYHFNLFRNLLEKSSSFLWINNYWDLINWENKDEFLRIINLYSHSSLDELEYRELSEKDKKIFIEKFEKFIQKYHFN